MTTPLLSLRSPSGDIKWRVRRLPAALALTEQGDVLRLRGKLDEAESAYGQAAELGYEPQPGLVLTWTLRGRTAAAVSAVRRLLAEARTPVHRSRLLPAAVEVMVAARLPDEARGYCEELSEIAAAFGNSALQAMSAYAAASVELITDHDQEALADARAVMSAVERHRFAVRNCPGASSDWAGTAQSR